MSNEYILSTVDQRGEGKRTHYFENRNFDLAAKVSKLPATALLSNFEMAALTGIAASSFTKPAQRQIMDLPEPIRMGRLMRWRMRDALAWLDSRALEKNESSNIKPKPPQHYARRGRPTKQQQLERAENLVGVL